MWYKEEHDQAPENLIKQTCTIVVKPFMAWACVKLK
jgi:hypothetical protein